MWTLLSGREPGVYYALTDGWSLFSSRLHCCLPARGAPNNTAGLAFDLSGCNHAHGVLAMVSRHVAVRGRAGFTTGAIYRSTRGPRSAAVAGAVGAVAAGALVFARKTLNKNL